MAKNIELSSWIERAHHKYNYKFEYDLNSFDIKTTNINIKCTKHGWFNKPLKFHIYYEYGCFECGKEARIQKKKIEPTIWLTKVQKIHNNKYSYPDLNFINLTQKITIICLEHGKFKQSPKSHLKYGCNKCAQEYRHLITRKSWNEILKLFKEKHQDKYNYDNKTYQGTHINMKIICQKHGDFWQTPKNHSSGTGCPRCIKKISKMETDWLNSLNIPNDKDHRYKKIIMEDSSFYYADGFDPKTNTIYEFNGDYYHGNPNKFPSHKLNKTCNKTFGELYQNTLIKQQNLIKAGFKVISIWESEYLILKSLGIL